MNDVKPGDILVVDWKRLHRVCWLPKGWFMGKVVVEAIHEFYVELRPKSGPVIVPGPNRTTRFAHTFGLTKEMLEIFCVQSKTKTA